MFFELCLFIELDSEVPTQAYILVPLVIRWFQSQTAFPQQPRPEQETLLFRIRSVARSGGGLSGANDPPFERQEKKILFCFSEKILLE